MARRSHYHAIAESSISIAPRRLRTGEWLAFHRSQHGLARLAVLGCHSLLRCDRKRLVGPPIGSGRVTSYHPRAAASGASEVQRCLHRIPRLRRSAQQGFVSRDARQLRREVSVTLERKFAFAMSMDDATWLRHANPWSVWSRASVLPLVILAVWSREWLGPWSWAAIALSVSWMWLNPRIFRRPVPRQHRAPRHRSGLPALHRSAGARQSGVQNDLAPPGRA